MHSIIRFLSDIFLSVMIEQPRDSWLICMILGIAGLLRRYPFGESFSK